MTSGAQGRRHEFHDGGYKSGIRERSERKIFFVPPNLYKLGGGLQDACNVYAVSI